MLTIYIQKDCSLQYFTSKLTNFSSVINSMILFHSESFVKNTLSTTCGICDGSYTAYSQKKGNIFSVFTKKDNISSLSAWKTISCTSPIMLSYDFWKLCITADDQHGRDNDNAMLLK